MSKRKNVEIFKDTIFHCMEDMDLRKSIENSIENQRIVFQKLERTPERYAKKAQVNIVSKRTFEAASRYRGRKTAVLNFASYTNPGGGVRYGSNAQEEALCRCSTLYIPLKEAEEEFYQKHRKQIEDDLITPLYADDCIYTPEVVVFKSDTRKPRLLDRDERYDVDVISCAAPNLRKKPSNSLNPNAGKKSVEIADEELLKIHRERISQIFQIAKDENVEVLILGAFGCGAFRNPPEIVAKAFKEVVDEFIYDFEVIEFAIYSSKGTENIDAFKRVFKENEATPFSNDLYEIVLDELLNGKDRKSIENMLNLKRGTIDDWFKDSEHDYITREDRMHMLKLKEKEHEIPSRLDYDYDVQNALYSLDVSGKMSLPEIIWLLNRGYDKELKMIERHFHDLMINDSLVKKERMEEMLDNGLRLPPISMALLAQKKRRYFPIPGMYGGFAYFLQYIDERFVLMWKAGPECLKVPKGFIRLQNMAVN